MSFLLFSILQFFITSSDKPYSLRQRTPSTRSSTYETRRSSRARLNSGKETQHLELDSKGQPKHLGTHF